MPTSPHGMTWVCHATGSATNPYVEILVDSHSLNGHGDHADDVFEVPAGGCETLTGPEDQSSAELDRSAGAPDRPGNSGQEDSSHEDSATGPMLPSETADTPGSESGETPPESEAGSPLVPETGEVPGDEGQSGETPESETPAGAPLMPETGQVPGDEGQTEETPESETPAGAPLMPAPPESETPAGAPLMPETGHGPGDEGQTGETPESEGETGQTLQSKSETGHQPAADGEVARSAALLPSTGVSARTFTLGALGVALSGAGGLILALRRRTEVAPRHRA